MSNLDRQMFKDYFGDETYTFSVYQYDNNSGSKSWNVNISFSHMRKRVEDADYRFSNHMYTPLFDKMIRRRGVEYLKNYIRDMFNGTETSEEDFNRRVKKNYDGLLALAKRIVEEDNQWYEQKKQDYIQKYHFEMVQRNNAIANLGKQPINGDKYPTESEIKEYMTGLPYPRHVVDAYERQRDEDDHNLTIIMNGGHPFGP